MIHRASPHFFVYPRVVMVLMEQQCSMPSTEVYWSYSNKYDRR